MKKWVALLTIAFALAFVVAPSLGVEILPQVEHPFPV